MNNDFTIKSHMGRRSELIIHPEKATALGLGNRKIAYISFGNQKHYVKIKTSHETSPANILLSQHLIKNLHLPEYPVYEICVNQNEIIIGPYIGLLTSNEDHKLTAARLNKMTVYAREYEKLHGALVVFALNKVDPENRLIEGYCFNPIENCWQRGVFPYPASIYRTIGLSIEWKNHFLSVIGDNLFNNRFFNKWEMHQWFSAEPEINSHLPYTVLYHSPQDVLDMLERFQKIYIKPILGLQGRRIVRLSTENGMLLCKSRENKENHLITLADPSKIREYIEQRFRHGRYLIQQAIDLLEYRGGLIDFRCVVQKNQSNTFVCQAMIGRYGVKDSIVSNISSGGAAFAAERILRKVFATSEENIADLKEKIAAFAVKVCNKLTDYGINCGNLGLDIGMDLHQQLWLIEINNRDPDPSIALDLHDTPLYYNLKIGPLFYAKFLAGFTD